MVVFVFNEAKFLNVIGTCYSQSPPPADFTPPNGFLQQQLKVDGSLALFTLSLCLPLKVALFFLLLLFIYI
jgi:hypothetical protein